MSNLKLLSSLLLILIFAQCTKEDIQTQIDPSIIDQISNSHEFNTYIRQHYALTQFTLENVNKDRNSLNNLLSSLESNISNTEKINAIEKFYPEDISSDFFEKLNSIYHSQLTILEKFPVLGNRTEKELDVIFEKCTRKWNVIEKTQIPPTESRWVNLTSD